MEFEPGQVPGLLALASMELELTELLGGRRVDLRTAEDLSRYFRDEVVRTLRDHGGLAALSAGGRVVSMGAAGCGR